MSQAVLLLNPKFVILRVKGINSSSFLLCEATELFVINMSIAILIKIIKYIIQVRFWELNPHVFDSLLKLGL